MTIEEVIAKLEKKMKEENNFASMFLDTAIDEENDSAFMYHSGKADGLKIAIYTIANLRKEEK